MNDPDRLDLAEIPVPAALLARVERDGMAMVHPTPGRRGSARKVAIDVVMTAFCLGHVVWIARIVNLLP
jgi:hypothetical protein